VSDRETPPFDLLEFARLEECLSTDRIAPESVASIIVSYADLRRLPLDHRVGFLLSLIDGRTTVAGLLDLCGMPTKEVVSILMDLVAQGIIELRSTSGR
jgi:hypothetical protein